MTLVLIVAQPDRLRDSLVILLAAMGEIKVVQSADSGPAALERFAASPPDLVLLDVNLSEAEALSTLGQIKAQWPCAPSIVLADHVEQQLAARDRGADTALLKGFSASELFVAIKKLLRQAPLDAPLNGACKAAATNHNGPGRRI